uniref:Uncharacterized protein n=1 Tax=Davidia involucrata TaxID=16924 RepID=A0A5B7BA49_DAVIN
MNVQLLFVVGIIALSITAEKCRQLVGEEASSKSWTHSFSFSNCFDMSYGTIACVAKECVKLYLYYIKAVHVHKVRNEATEAALSEESPRSRQSLEAMKRAHEKGNAAAMGASLQIKHITGPLITSGWDMFETIYIGGTLAEGTIRGIGAFVGAYAGGHTGEGKLGWIGYLVGSHLGSWVGGRIGLMAYDVWNGVEYLLHYYSLGCKSNSLMETKLFRIPFFN